MLFFQCGKPHTSITHTPLLQPLTLLPFTSGTHFKLSIIKHIPVYEAFFASVANWANGNIQKGIGMAVLCGMLYIFQPLIKVFKGCPCSPLLITFHTDAPCFFFLFWFYYTLIQAACHYCLFLTEHPKNVQWLTCLHVQPPSWQGRTEREPKKGDFPLRKRTDN